MKLTEKQVTEQVIGYLRTRGWYCVRLNSGLVSTPDGRRLRVGKKGLPDWVVFRAVQYCFLEIKATGKGLRMEQDEWYADARAKGITATWTDDLENIKASEYFR